MDRSMTNRIIMVKDREVDITSTVIITIIITKIVEITRDSRRTKIIKIIIKIKATIRTNRMYTIKNKLNNKISPIRLRGIVRIALVLLNLGLGMKNLRLIVIKKNLKIKIWKFIKSKMFQIQKVLKILKPYV